MWAVLLLFIEGDLFDFKDRRTIHSNLIMPLEVFVVESNVIVICHFGIVGYFLAGYEGNSNCKVLASLVIVRNSGVVLSQTGGPYSRISGLYIPMRKYQL